MKIKRVREYLNEALESSSINVIINNLRELFEDTFFNSNVEVMNKDNHVFVFVKLSDGDEYESIIKDIVNSPQTIALFQDQGFQITDVKLKKEQFETLVDIEYSKYGQEKEPEQREEKVKKYKDMGQAELNYQLNLALDKKDWKTAEEISKYMKIKESLKTRRIKMVRESLEEEIKKEYINKNQNK
jgi:hypothetical protein